MKRKFNEKQISKEIKEYYINIMKKQKKDPNTKEKEKEQENVKKEKEFKEENKKSIIENNNNNNLKILNNKEDIINYIIEYLEIKEVIIFSLSSKKFLYYSNNYCKKKN
jgi:hypothetical protein